MNKKQKPTQTTEPAIAVEPVLAPVDLFPFTHAWLENGQSFKKTAESLNHSLAVVNNRLRKELIKIANLTNKETRNYYWCRIAEQRKKRFELIHDLEYLKLKERDHQTFLNSTKYQTWAKWINKDLSYTDAAMGAMEEYAKLKCAEQRYECQIEWNKRSILKDGVWYVSCDDVINADEPNWR